MRFFFATILVLASGGIAGAHIGNENSTEIRVYSDSMRVVLRTSIPFAWTLLGDNPPAMADDAGQAIAKPLLLAAAPSLLTLSAAGKPMTPTLVDCVFELQTDVAFVYNFKRPAEWPVVAKVEFFDRLGNLETGTIAVSDYTASRFARDVEPLVQQVVDRSNPSLSFSLAQPVPVAEPLPPVVFKLDDAVDREIHGRGWLGISILLLGVGAVGLLVRRRLRGIKGGD